MSAAFAMPEGVGHADPAYLAAIQRGRVIVAVVEVAEQVGYRGLTVRLILARAKVSRKTFYELFATREEAFAAALTHTIASATPLVAEAFAGEPTWRAGIRASLARLLVLMEAEPALARLWVIEINCGGELLLELRAQMLDALARAVDRGRAGAAYEPPAVTASATVGCVVETVHARLVREPEPPLIDLLGQLMSMITLPYLGARVARRELSKPSSSAARGRAATARLVQSNPLAVAGIRLTYRTMRVLTVIGERPGLSNRDVGIGAGIGDQGQVSKLLKRLAQSELIENFGAGQPQGRANAWRLTADGERLQSAAAAHGAAGRGLRSSGSASRSVQ